MATSATANPTEAEATNRREKELGLGLGVIGVSLFRWRDASAMVEPPLKWKSDEQKSLG